MGMRRAWAGLVKPKTVPSRKTWKLRFFTWIDNGHNDFADSDTIILRIALTDGVLLSRGVRYDL